MKRSTTVKMAILGAGALTLSACGESTEEVLTYESVEACISAGVQDDATCRAEFDKAKALHETVAPRYQGASGCYAEFGYNRCYRSSTGSYWLPFMVGYMLAPRMSMGGIYSQPLYRPSSNPNRFHTSSGVNVGNVSASGRAQVAKSQTARPQARTRTVARGGFGARSRSSAS